MNINLIFEKINPANLIISPTSVNGYHIILNNDYRVSIQWGPGTYSDNHDSRSFDYQVRLPSDTAEVAVINPAGDLIETPFAPDDTVIGWQKMSQIVKIVEWTSKL